MGGRIWVEEGPGGGSVFRFTARFGRPDAAEAAMLAGPMAPAVAGRPARAGRRRARDRPRRHRRDARRLGDGADGRRPTPATAVRGGPRRGPRGPAVRRGGGRRPARGTVPGRGRHPADPARVRIPRRRGRPPIPARRRSSSGCPSRPRQSDLFNALAVARGRRPARSSRPAAPARRPAVADRPLRVLLVEDHPINQVVATRMLERLGHRATVARDGHEALATLDAAGPFDLVLMDLQMPGMDGFEAVAAIRDRESARRGADAGRRPDGARHGRRPREVPGLGLRRLHPQADPRRRPGAGPGRVRRGPARPPAAVFRPEVLAESCDGEAEVIAEVLDSFAADAPSEVERIVVALAEGDLAAARRAAHGLRGACASVGAEALAAACLRIEGLPEGAAVPHPEATRADLAVAWDSLRPAIEAHRESLELSRVAT